MALHIFSTVVSDRIPSSYYFPVILTLLLLAIIRAYSQGRRTNRDRDLHARTVILTGAFTPLGLTLLEFLAKKGAHIIALVPTSSLTSHQAEILSLLRSTTSNEAIYAEPCPLDSPAGIKKFCERFVNTEHEKDRRLDALILGHEYGHIGTWSAGAGKMTDLRDKESMKRDEGAMATFLLTTLLLPAMLVAPVERDIRIINFVNPFYAAAASAFEPRLSSATYKRAKSGSGNSKPTFSGVQHHSSWALEGQRALRTAVFTRHLQRILDALPGPGFAPASSSSNTSKGIGHSAGNSSTPQKSNILAVTVSPGISRTETVASYLLPPTSHVSSATRHWVGALLYVVLWPFLHLLTKTPMSALQSVIHVLCVPKPHTRRRVPVAEDVAQPPSRAQSQTPLQRPGRASSGAAEEVLVPGALYADCAVVTLGLRVPELISKDLQDQARNDDSEQLKLGLGNEPLGRAVWEALEEGVNIWEERKGAR